jgi:4-amino-4-deoxy-L-arabinose transferase-like glycosyltransferase
LNSVLSGLAPAASSEAARYERLLMAVLVPLTLLRWLMAAGFELCGDEAYYWLWSRHLDLAYYSKGPAVAAVIALATELFGDSSFGVRAFAPLLGAATMLGVFVLGRMLYDSRVGFWAAAVATVMPMTALGGLLQTIDPLSICAWTWSLVLLARVCATPSTGLWLAAGLLIGAGALAKYTNLTLVPSFLLFCLISRAHRPLLASRGLWLMLAVVLACLVPVLIWQTGHGWVTVTHLKQNSAFGTAPQISAQEFGIFMGLQLAVSFPVLIAAALAVPVLADRARDAAPQDSAQAEPLTFLLALSLPLFASYAAMAWIKAGEPNWVAPSYLGFAVLAAAGGVQRWQRPRARVWRRVTVAVLVLALVMNSMVLLAPFVPFPHDAGVKSRISGGALLAARVQALEAGHGASFIIGGHYQIASLLAFYSPDHPAVYTPSSNVPRNQFFYWPDYRQTRHDGENAVYVSFNADVPPVLTRQFAQVHLLEAFTPRPGGRPLKPYYLYLCEQLHRSAAP